MYLPDSTLNFCCWPSTIPLSRCTSRFSESFSKIGSQSSPQITLIAFQPAPRKTASSSWMILPLPRTGPSNRWRLQLTTKIRLSSFSRAARDIEPSVSGSSVSPSPKNAQTLASEGAFKPRSSR
jgi:hypothetical protein